MAKAAPAGKKITPASRALLKILPDDAELQNRLNGLKSQGHMATALVGASFLDHSLEIMIRSQFIVLNKEDDKRMFDGASGGILGTFSAKIRISHAMGLVHSNPYTALLLINDIRNVFAHSLHRITFNHPQIKKDCTALTQISKALYEVAHIKEDTPPIDVYLKYVAILYQSIRDFSENNAKSFLHDTSPKYFRGVFIDK